MTGRPSESIIISMRYRNVNDHRMKLLHPDISNIGFADLHSNGNHHYYENEQQDGQEELLISTASMTALRLQKVETTLEKVTELATQEEEYVKTRRKLEEGTMEKRLTHYAAKGGLLYWKNS